MEKVHKIDAQIPVRLMTPYAGLDMATKAIKKGEEICFF